MKHIERMIWTLIDELGLDLKNNPEASKKISDRVDEIENMIKTGQLDYLKFSWIPILGNENIFNIHAKRNCMVKFDDGSYCRYFSEHPLAELTHFKIDR